MQWGREDVASLRARAEHAQATAGDLQVALSVTLHRLRRLQITNAIIRARTTMTSTSRGVTIPATRFRRPTTAIT